METLAANMEILAPAGSYAALEAAVRAGANAVYLGLGSFNARKNAQNFSDEELKSAISFCHCRGVLVYVALNTLVFDDEITAAASAVKTICESGADAVIVQDLGLIEIIKAVAPALPIHASTQLTVHDVSGVRHMHESGIKRVVLARENSLEEIKRIAAYANKNGVELEVFVQGALCMSMSGQCLLSAVLGSRSGNRGLCAGPCRLPFRVSNGNGYDLSLKDNNLYNHLEELRELNIVSMKIEGRMKRPEYVAMAVSAARAAVNGDETLNEKLSLLQNVFSRGGFTDGYFTAQRDKNMFGVRSEQDITASKETISSIHEIYRRERQSVPIFGKLTLKADEQVKFEISDKQGHSVTVCGDTAQTAVSRAADRDFVVDKLSKCGGTPFYFEQLECQLDDGLSVRASELSALRKTALEDLNEKRSATKAIPFYADRMPVVYSSSRRSDEYRMIASVDDISQITDRLKNLDLILIPLSVDIDKAAALIKDGCKIGIKTPPCCFKGYDSLLERLIAFKKIGVSVALADNIGALDVIRKANLSTVAGTGLNCCNSYSVNALGCDTTLLSCELDEQRIKSIRSGKPVGLFAYGKLPLMLLHSCPIRANVGCTKCNNKITDRLGIEFLIKCVDGATRLYNSRPLYIGDKPTLLNCADYAYLAFTDEAPAEIDRVLDCFENALPLGREYTRGLYFKGVK